MIPTVLGAVEASSITGAVLCREHLLRDASQGLQDDGDFSLDRLWQIKCDPTASRTNMRLVSVSEAVQEVQAFKDAGGTLIIDTTLRRHRRDAAGLAEISRRTGVAVVAAASCADAYPEEAALGQSYEDAAAADIQYQLLHGVAAALSGGSSTAGSGGEKIQCGVAVVELAGGGDIDAQQRLELERSQWDGAPAAPPYALAAAEVAQLRAAARAQCACAAACAGARPPLLVLVPPFAFAPAARAVLDVLRAVHADVVTATVLCGATAAAARADALRPLLSAGATLCFDAFGRAACDGGADAGPVLPGDAADAALVAALLSDAARGSSGNGGTGQDGAASGPSSAHGRSNIVNGHSGSSSSILGHGSGGSGGGSGGVLLSQGVTQRLHLLRGGGCGYAHVQRSAAPRLRRAGAADAAIAGATRGRALSLLDWFTPPPAVARRREFASCSWCAGAFERIEGEYYSKFAFVYCKVACLRAHRDAGFPVQEPPP
ncbi:hypothetical protein JKP88DRAFT_352399 [Tribonema minus]|uniref:Vms1-associating treble clef domain-containing protein n=1 Tax=Tribonema minus TaxID=303371 RepID=A0A835ZDS4_9STRA|nr:hypothetical protein JKP88DRAFT_352399 [Tribonema minus]